VRVVGTFGSFVLLLLLLLLLLLFPAGDGVVRARVVHVVQLVERESVHGASVVWQSRGARGCDLGGCVGVHCAGVSSCCGGEERRAGAVSLETFGVVV
jgi:hypothetical protein